MTRIIAGRLGGRTLTVPPGVTRPTTDRVREALFSAIVARMDPEGAVVLDLFAGSGALGLEAASRGAESVWFVEADGRAAGTLRGNVRSLSGGSPSIRTTVRRAALPAAVAGPCPVEGGFDLVLADPPYARSAELDAPVLDALLAGGWLAPDALVVWERSKRDPAVRWPEGLEVEFSRTYGETAVEMARPGSSSSPVTGPVATVGT